MCRSFGSAINVKTQKPPYISLVRAQPTYCSTIWRPHLLKDIFLVESVQKHSIKWTLDDYKSDYKSGLKVLHLLPFMIVYELNNLSFLLKSLQSPSQSFNIMDYDSFSSSSTCSFGIKLQHLFRRNNVLPLFLHSSLSPVEFTLPVDLDPSSSQTI